MSPACGRCGANQRLLQSVHASEASSLSFRESATILHGSRNPNRYARPGFPMLAGWMRT